MGGNHPKNIDPRPKRRKDKDNPYEIFTTGLGTAQPHYFLAFVDSTGVEQCMEIDKALFDILLNMDKRENEIVDGELAEDEPAQGRDNSDRGR